MNDPFDILRDQLEAAARPRPRNRALGGRLRGPARDGGWAVACCAQARRRAGAVGWCSSRRPARSACSPSPPR